MFHLVAVVFGLAAAGSGAFQAQIETIRSWNLSWVDVADAVGNQRTVPMLSWAGGQPPANHIKYAAPREISVVAMLDFGFRTAKLSNDTAALARMLSLDFVEIDQDGNSLSRADLIEKARTSKISSLRVNRATARFSDTAVTIVGEETEVNPSGFNRLLFTRVYVQEPSKEWTLLASTRFQKP